MRILLKERGSAMLAIMGIVGAIGVGVMLFSEKNNQLRKMVSIDNERKQGEIVISKLQAFSNFLISSNLILCKEGPFKGLSKNEGYRCKWSGIQYTSGESKQVSLDNLGLSARTYDDKGFLVFEMDSSKILSKEEAEASGIELLQLKGEISFKLYDLVKDENNLKNNFPIAPEAQRNADIDRAVVLIRIKVKYGQRYVLRNFVNSEGQIEYKREQSKGEEIIAYFGIKRPIAIPSIKINSAACQASCETGIVNSKTPECRSEQSFANGSDAKIEAQLTNKGPGVLYALQFEKHVKYDETKFPSQENPPVTVVDAMPEFDYLLPGQSVTWSDSLTCLTIQTPAVTTNVSQSQSRRDANGNPICYTTNITKPIPCPSAGTSKQISQHSEASGSVKYKLEIIPSSNDQFYSNKSLSHIEPSKLAFKVVEDEQGIPMKEETTTIITIIATH